MEQNFEQKTQTSLKNQTVGIKNIDVLSSKGLLRNSSLLIENGLIKQIGAKDDGHFIDGCGYLTTPGLINSHTHTAMTFLRDLAHGTDDVISNLFFKTEKQLTLELVEKLSYSFLLSALRSGTTCVFDHYYFSQGVGNALERLGMRGCIGETLADLGGAFPSETKWKEVQSEIENWSFSRRITPAIAPHAIDTVSDKLGRQLGDFSKNSKLPIHFHISQRKSEFEGSLRIHGKTPVELAHQRNWLGENALAVHLLYLGENDLDLLSSTGTTVANCPSSQIIYEQLAPIEKFYRANIPLCVGTDCNASSDQADIFAELKTFTLLLKDRGIKTEDLYKKCFQAVSTIPAKVAQLNLGEIKENSPADLVFIKQDLENLPLREVWTHLLFSIQSSQVRHVMIDGRWALWNRESTQAKEIELRSEFLEALSRIKL